MATSPVRGRAVGALLLLQMATGLILPFVFILPINIGSPEFLVPALAESARVRAAVLVAFVGGALCIAIAATIFPVLRRRSETLAVALVASCTVSAALDAVHNGTVMSLLAVAKQAPDFPPGDASLIAMAATAYSARVAAHYAQLVGFAGWLFVFYTAMFRFRLVPRPIAVLGLAAIVFQFSGVTLSHYLGYTIQGIFAMPLAPVHLLTATWLLVKGFDRPAMGENQNEEVQCDSYVIS